MARRCIEAMALGALLATLDTAAAQVPPPPVPIQTPHPNPSSSLVLPQAPEVPVSPGPGPGAAAVVRGPPGVVEPYPGPHDRSNHPRRHSKAFPDRRRIDRHDR
ncbi:MAG: hypothetical protein KGI48_12935 [Hyphomicrobiales bacterium]|nr:hypothetical protein [Hyphomicrobiales bacterium]